MPFSEEQVSTLMSTIKELGDANHSLKEELALVSPAGGQFVEGNAIFTDVEEQRLAMEKELITMKVCCTLDCMIALTHAQDQLLCSSNQLRNCRQAAPAAPLASPDAHANERQRSRHCDAAEN